MTQCISAIDFCVNMCCDGNVPSHAGVHFSFAFDCFDFKTACQFRHRFHPQDEYSIFPQTYSIDINGYILVYSVTSNKRSAFSTL